MPKVWNKHHKNAPKDAVYVGRPTKWGNPYTVEAHGRGDALEAYNAWIWLDPQLKLREAAKRELKGKDLVCWCAPKACHAEILMEIANAE